MAIDERDLDTAPDLIEPPKKKRVKRKSIGDLPTDSKPDPDKITIEGTATTQFSVMDGAQALMDVMATVHESRENVCCAEMYRRQKKPVSYALNELAKDSPILQHWITHGKAFKVIALMVAVEPIAEHHWRAHLHPSLLKRREEQQRAYDEWQAEQEIIEHPPVVEPV